MPASKAFTIWTEAVLTSPPAAARLIALPPSKAFTIWTAGGRTPAVIPSPPSRAFTLWTKAVADGSLRVGGKSPVPVLTLPASQAFTVWTRAALAPSPPPVAVATAESARASIFIEETDEEATVPLSRMLVRWFLIPAAAVLVFIGFYQLSGEIEGLENDKSTLIGEKADLSGRLDVSEDENAKLEDIRRKLEVEGRSLTVKLGETRQQLVQTENANTSLERLVKDLKGEVALWKKDMKAATERHAGEKASMEDIIAGNKSRIAKLEIDLDATKKTLATRETTLAEREKTITTRDQVIASLKTETNANAKTIAALKAELATAMTRIAEVQTLADTRGKELATANESLKAAAEVAVKVQARIAELEAALKQAEEAAKNPPAPPEPAPAPAE